MSEKTANVQNNGSEMFVYENTVHQQRYLIGR